MLYLAWIKRTTKLKIHIMKKTYYLIFALLMIVSISYAQKDKSKRASPPATAMNTISGLEIKIDYSQPSVNDREVWGKLVPYGEVWRTGANEATTISFSKDVTISGEKVKAGKYSLFTIPGEKEWTLILNKKWDQWGAYKYKKDEDVLRIIVRPQKTDGKTEKLTFDVNNSGQVTMKWDNLMFAFDVKADMASAE